MTQYWEIKSAHQDKVLLFRMGDFFEMFHEDARLAAPILEIALTQRNKKSEDDTPMCGVPHHSIAGPINKLLSEGHKVAICDQVEDPKEAKGIVKRAVTRILSPGMVYDPDTLDELSTNYLCSYDHQSVSFLETTTGEAFFYEVKSIEEARSFLNLLSPKEVVLKKNEVENEKEILKNFYFTAHDELFEVHQAPQTSCRLMSYACYMQGESINSLISGFEKRERSQKMNLPVTALRHLEIFENYRGERKGSLFEALRRTKTSVGSRLLREWLCFPLASEKEINQRLDEVEFWTKNFTLVQEVRSILSGMGDIERRLGKISTPQCHARDLMSLSLSLEAGFQIDQLISHWNHTTYKKSLQPAKELSLKIQKIISEETPAQMKNGGFIKRGFRTDLDELIDLSSDTQKALSQMEAQEKEKTGISSLKIRYNNVFGYYIEVTNTHKDKVPAHYIRKQTLANAERYVTEELGQLEAKVLSARTRRIEVEFEVFADLKEEILKTSPHLLLLAHVWSEVDVYTSLAWLALEEKYVRPTFSKDKSLNLVASRHPVVEQEMSADFIPNDIELSPSHCLLLTGPNMAGKSTLMRQVAVISIMAQIGSFVPAQTAQIPLFDKVFTRIGASDFLTEGLSTFMVEMTETAEMLKQAGEDSLVVLDEIGRGTSTYDGMSLAQSILEFLVGDSKSMTLFATHYHELTVLADKYSAIQNGHMSIRENKNQIEFLHTLSAGPANRSYGIQVAQLAGLPPKVINRAAKILSSLENQNEREESLQMSLLSFSAPSEEEEITDTSSVILDEEQQQLLQELKEMAVQEVTPLEALNKIAKWQQSLS